MLVFALNSVLAPVNRLQHCLHVFYLEENKNHI